MAKTPALNAFAVSKTLLCFFSVLVPHSPSDPPLSLPLFEYPVLLPILSFHPAALQGFLDFASLRR